MKRRRLLLLMLTVTALCMTAGSAEYSKSEWRVRPWEIINGLKPHSDTIWQLDKDSLQGWKVSGAGAELSETSVTKLWGEKVAKLTFPKGGSVTVFLPEPIKFNQKIDGFDLWIYGPINNGVGTRPDLTFLISDADGRKIRVDSMGMGSRWNRVRWWGMAAAIIPPDIKYPITLHSFTFSRLLTRTENDFLCFDMLGAFTFPRKMRFPDSAEMKLPFPTTPDTIMPKGMAEGAKNSIVKLPGNAWSFNYDGNDAKLSYIYRPSSGTLGDITVKLNDAKEFQIAAAGGIHGEVDGVKFAPLDKDKKASLLNAKLNGEKLMTKWRWSKSGKNLDFRLKFNIK